MMQKRIVSIITALAMSGFRPMQAKQDFTVSLHPDEELDWTAGSALGLQRSAQVIKKEPARPSKDINIGTSLLGLQRSTTLQKTDKKEVIVELSSENELDWSTGTTLGLQRSATIIKRQHKEKPLGTSLLGLQRSTKLQKTDEKKVIVELSSENELDWNSGTTLGLQRSATIIRRQHKEKAATPSGASLLGLQRSTHLSKTSDKKFAEDMFPEDEVPLSSASTLGLQRSASLIRKQPARKEEKPQGNTFAGLQRSTRLRKPPSQSEPVNVPHPSGIMQASLLGFQRGIKVQKIAPNATNADMQNATRAAENASESSPSTNTAVATDLAKVSMLGMQRDTKLSKVVLADDEY